MTAAEKSRVALVQGTDRIENIRHALSLIDDTISSRVHGQVFIKPNLLSHESQFPSTHPDALRAVLSVVCAKQPRRVIVAEGATDATAGFRNLGFLKLADQYPIEFFDINRQETEWDSMPAITVNGDEHEVGVSALALGSDCRISIALPKVHTTAVVTLSIKNFMSCIRESDRIRMHGYRGDKTAGDAKKPWAVKIYEMLKNDSLAARGMTQLIGMAKGAKNSIRLGSLQPSPSAVLPPRDFAFLRSVYAMKRNLAQLAAFVGPHISVIDGMYGMEGEGPRHGSKVQMNMAVASADCVAADAVCAALMGFDPKEIGYLHYAQELGVGCADLDNIEVLGADIAAVRRAFKPHSNYLVQRHWRMLDKTWRESMVAPLTAAV